MIPSLAATINPTVATILSALGAILVALIALYGTRSGKRDDREDAEWSRVENRLNGQDAKIAALEAHGRIQDDYIFKLRRQVSQLGGEPEPWPDELSKGK